MKILLFDVWTKGINNFSRLHEGLVGYGFECKLFHLESWSNPSVLIEDNIKGIECYDISYYNTWNIAKVIKKEKPDLVVILSLAFILDRTIVSICKKYGVKIVYLSHGQLKDVEGFQSLSNFLRRRMKLKPLLVLLNYIYVNFCLYFRPWRVLSRLKNSFFNNDKAIYSRYGDEFDVDRGLVFFDSEKEMFDCIRCFPSSKIHSVGNPEMDYIINGVVEGKTVFFSNLGIESSQKYVLYMDDGYVQSQFLELEEWIKDTDEINKICQKNDYKLVIKLHPRTNRNKIEQFATDNGIILVSDTDMKSLIFYSTLMLSYSSSTIVYALHLRRPVVMPRWGKFEEIANSYPDDCVYYVNSREAFCHMLTDSIEPKDGYDYLTSVLGQVDGHATERILESIKEIVLSR